MVDLEQKQKNFEIFKQQLRQKELHSLYKLSGLPERFKEKIILEVVEEDLEAYELLSDIEKNIKLLVQDEGMQLLLYSDNFGNGKTSWAIKLMQAYFEEVWDANGYKQRAIYVNVAEFMYKVKQNFETPNEEFAKMVKDIRDVDLVVWDDVGGTRMTEFDQEQLYVHVNARIFANKANIYTTNLIDDALKEVVGGRLHSRIQHTSFIVEFVGSDFRRGKDIYEILYK